MSKLIGIVGYPTENYFGASKTYLQFCQIFGTPIIVNPTDLETFNNFYLKNLDLLILPGGGDVDVTRYNQIPEYGTYSSNQFLEYFDKSILPYIIGRIPIVGICRGIQTLNVLMDGKLQQDLPYHPHSSLGRGDLVHEVKEYGKEGGIKFKVNSLHHQGIRLSTLSKDLVPLLISEDFVVESVENKKYKVFGVQWHPEEILDQYTIDKIFELLEEKEG